MLVIHFLLVSCRAYSSALKMEVTCPSKMLVDFQKITQCYISEERTLYIEICLQFSQYSGCAMGRMTEEVGSDSFQRQDILSSSQCPDHNVKLIFHLHLVPRLKTHGEISPLLHISSWYGA
jgi:hypothetical protein